ncbi:ABC transporter permease [Agromyces cerinus]|uniref:Transport permease protein n=1 Tax=Agromyces cerinus subsp. cerinus TaxID=232089 RepID=A0A1N6HFS4_9MICO|nr:ABC transporter permease [Agromyces cerinus]SIO18612.1 ABC-2 type transport system permease protein [Agromyces cerinus subsp. cerinus]
MTTITTLPTASAPVRAELGPFTAESTFIARSFRHSVRDIDAMLMAVLLPTMLMLMFTFIFGNAIDPSGGYVDYVVPGIILLCAGFGASSTAISVSRDMTTGIIDRFRTMPLRSGAVTTGHVVASLARNLVATGVVIAVALLVGFRPSATPLEWLAVFGLVALYILAITYLFAAIGLAASSPEAASGYGFILLFLPYLSSAFVPVETMPGWLQWIAENQPITPVIETIRGLLMGTPIGDSAWWAIGWCVGIVVVSVVWGGWLFRRRAGRR